MTDNPYQPPKAPLEVAPSSRRERGPAPDSVKYAVKLLWISSALLVPFVIALAIGIQLPGGAVSSFVDAAANTVTIAALIVFAKKIAAARNWARWIYAILAAIGTALIVYSIVALPDAWFAMPLWIRAFNSVQNLLQLAAAVLLFLPKSNAWFAKIDDAQAPS